MKETTNSYAWIVISLLVLSIIILLAAPFGEVIQKAVESNVEVVGDKTDIVLENIKVEGGFGANKHYTYYTQDNLDALGDRAVVLGHTGPLYVVGIYSNDFSEVIISRNGKKSDGIMKGNTFKDNVKLTSAIIKPGVMNVPGGAFENCSNLTDVYLPEGLRYIGYKSFYGTSITSITIPSSVETIEAYAFSNCPNLKEIIFSGRKRPTGFYEDDYPGITVTYNR